MQLRHRIASFLTTFTMVLLVANGALGQKAESSQSVEADAYSPDTVVALIDGQPLYLRELLFRYATLSDRTRQAYGSSDDGLARYLHDVVAGLVVVREADKLDLAQGDLARRLVDLRREDALRDLYARATLLDELDETTLRARYNAQIDRFRVPLRVRASHILIKVAPGEGARQQALSRAMALRLQIEQGSNFAEVARQSSDDLTAARGGDLGWVTAGVLVADLEKAAFALASGEVSQVVKSELGYHIARVSGRREAGLLPFELVRELILQELIGERRQDLAIKANTKGQELLSSHDVEMFPDRLPW